MDDRLPVEEALSHELLRHARISQMLKSRAGSWFPSGLDHAAVAVLMTLIRRGPLRQGELADHALLDPSTVSRHVGQLVRTELVERRPDPADGRAVQLVATGAGHDFGAELTRRRQAMIHQALADWSKDDVQIFIGLLSRLNDDFESPGRTTTPAASQTTSPATDQES